MGYSQDVMDHPPFQLHLEPETPIELSVMLRCLGAIGHQFEVFAAAEGLTSSKDAKLLVSSVKPGSIDIGLLPDLSTLGTLVAPVMVYSAPVLKFATALKGLIDKFKKKPEPVGITIKDCSDVANIVAPSAQSGGTQTIHIYNAPVYQPVVHVTQEDAKIIQANALEMKALLEAEALEVVQRTPMILYGMDADAARTAGARSPDKAIIEEIDPKHRPVFFEDEFAGLKSEMLAGHDNPYKRIYFVDVKVSRVAGRVVSYRIIGFHGSEEIPDEEDD